ncbi:hypothetical protein [Actinosynnema mirum]|uniref:Uncharacterized protein n=1 Tax=Actinosynnema mirum (strain ATCC 29888 / DSM 43827 / JCM 3225 / NBRC 14064 / NCIMB 13271 / NRRL B-12336 / IMRU 3971 / 101) TaxID=446462 RepID=C6WBM2_ACTMD|nr:hypothetical protein [Actinosynnema mirum]ACU35590.1 hypothetical protein Amir_1641 [Actinosynnema mirum DSM 43827]
MSDWRMARSLDALLGQLNALAPNRSRASDGGIGDTAHRMQGASSDHNPWFRGMVTARDFTHDPAGGLDCDRLAAALIASRDPRIKYLIWRGRICDSRAPFKPWTWQPSSGHHQHLHLSVMDNNSADDARPWALPGLIEEDDPFMALTKDDLADAVKTGVENAFWRRYDEGRNLVDDEKEQTARLIAIDADGDKVVAAVQENTKVLRELLAAVTGKAVTK